MTRIISGSGWCSGRWNGIQQLETQTGASEATVSQEDHEARSVAAMPQVFLRADK